MNPGQTKALCLIGVGILTALQFGCRRASEPGAGAIYQGKVVDKPDRVVTISQSLEPPQPGHPQSCEVDFPIVVLRIQKSHKIAWAALDQAQDYWVVFDKGNANANNGNKSNPIGNDTIYVQHTNQTSNFDITISLSPAVDESYFKYAIYSFDPSKAPPASNPTGYPCKTADDDHDTGVNVKR
jgi:hypothetical protein